MKFVDEAKITVAAGKGGKGCVSFRREKFVPFGGPDGGDGGDGGSVYLVASPKINTLVEFQYQKFFSAKNGQGGAGANRRGKSGPDLEVEVPVGTLVYCQETNEQLADLSKIGDRVKVAQGGFHGIGNARYKTSTNRAPRTSSPGSEGERRTLKLELRVLADVGLLGYPNAGKSTLIRALSRAQPKVADYPFTTLVPQLGVVRVDAARSFVMADIPGLIEGAAEGAGLGFQFLRHLSRTRCLVHLIDILPPDGRDPAEEAQRLLEELSRYDGELLNKPRVLVFNKGDLLDEELLEEQKALVLSALDWEGPVMTISALKNQGTDALKRTLMDIIELNTATLPAEISDTDHAQGMVVDIDALFDNA